MAARVKAPEPVTSGREKAWIDARGVSSDVNGLKCIAEFLADLDAGSISMQVPDQTKEWLCGILYGWMADTAAHVEAQADHVEAFLRPEPPKAEVA